MKEVPTKYPQQAGRGEEVRRNKRIRVSEVRLIDEEGAQLGVFATYEAIRRAEEAGLDLVEISPNARPPVCRIMDYGKYMYELQKKKNEAKKRQVVVRVKEIKMRPATDEHDFQVKLRHIKEFLEEGDKVKVTVRFRGREMAHRDLGEERINRVIREVVGMGEVAFPATLEGRQMSMMLAPVRRSKSGERREHATAENKEERSKTVSPVAIRKD